LPYGLTPHYNNPHSYYCYNRICVCLGTSNNSIIKIESYLLLTDNH